MASQHHIHATDQVTLCGRPVGAWTLGTPDAREFARLIADPDYTFCRRCLRLARRNGLNSVQLRRSIVARMQAMGLAVDYA